MNNELELSVVVKRNNTVDHMHEENNLIEFNLREVVQYIVFIKTHVEIEYFCKNSIGNTVLV